MRIAISGSACQGKTTLINDFLKNWPGYKKSSESYRKIVKEKSLPINKKVTKESQWEILNALIDDQQQTTKGDKVIFDRCTLDNIVYSLWSLDKQNSDIDKEFIDKCIPLIKESMKHIDIIFFLPITKVAPVNISEKELRETDQEYITEIDNIFKAITYQVHQKGASPFFHKDDMPAIIEIFGSPEERIKMIELYLDKTGDLIGESQSVLNMENLELIETLLKTQKQAKEKEEEEIRLRKKFMLKQ